MDDTEWKEFQTHIEKRYSEIRGNEIKSYISNNLKKATKTTNGESLKIPYMSDSDRTLVQTELLDGLPEMYKKLVTYNTETGIIETTE